MAYRDNDYYAKDQAPTGLVGMAIPVTKRKQLEQKKFYLEQELGKVNKAIEALDSFPELEQFLDVMQNAL